MSEEVQEQAPVAEEQQTEAGPKKKKKINQLNPNELNKLIEEYEKNGQTQSRFYKHLIYRKNELNKTVPA